jgi:transposase-like protein
MPSPIADETRAAILADINTGTKSRGAIAREHGVSTTTVSKIARDAGIDQPFSRENTEKATAAAVSDAKHRRAALASDALDGATTALAALRQRIAKMSDRDLITLFGVATDKHVALNRIDSDAQGLSAVDDWLRHMMGEGNTPP